MPSMLCGGLAWSRAAVPAGRAELTWPVALCLQPGHLVHDDAALGEPQDAHRRPGSPLAAWQPEGTQQRPRLQAGLRVTRTPVLRTAQRLADVLSGSASRARAAEADSERVPSEQLLGSPVARRSGSLPPGNGHSRRTPPPAGRELHCHTHQLEARFGRQEARACVPGKTETRLDWKIDTGSESRTYAYWGWCGRRCKGPYTATPQPGHFAAISAACVCGSCSRSTFSASAYTWSPPKRTATPCPSPSFTASPSLEPGAESASAQAHACSAGGQCQWTLLTPCSPWSTRSSALTSGVPLLRAMQVRSQVKAALVMLALMQQRPH